MLSCDQQGIPNIVNFVGFGSANEHSVILQPGDWNSGIIPITQITAYPCSFIMPYNGTLRNIHLLFANREELFFTAGVTMHPFVCLATLIENSGFVFTVINDTLTYTEPYIGNTYIPKYSLRKGYRNNLDIEIAEGTVVGIVIGWMGEELDVEEQGRFSVSGGLFFE